MYLYWHFQKKILWTVKTFVYTAYSIYQKNNLIWAFQIPSNVLFCYWLGEAFFILHIRKMENLGSEG